MMGIIEIPYNDEISFLIETDQIPDNDDDLFEPVAGNRAQKLIRGSNDLLRTALDKVIKFCNSISASVNEIKINPDEIEFEFGFKINAEAGIVIASYGTEASIGVKVKWCKKEGV